MIITIDGPAGTGKSTVARRLAQALGFVYFDTGAMYRALTLEMIGSNISPDDEESTRKILAHFPFRMENDSGHFRYYLGEQEISDEIRTPEVTALVSQVAARPWVRQSLVQIQRQFSTACDAVYEGRDLGSVVFPHATMKIFLTASPEIRAQRRYAEWQAKGSQGSPPLDQVLKDLIRRDHLDSTREHSPLVQPKDAHVVDTSDLTIDEVVHELIKLWNNTPH